MPFFERFDWCRLMDRSRKVPKDDTWFIFDALKVPSLSGLGLYLQGPARVRAFFPAAATAMFYIPLESSAQELPGNGVFMHVVCILMEKTESQSLLGQFGRRFNPGHPDFSQMLLLALPAEH